MVGKDKMSGYQGLRRGDGIGSKDSRVPGVKELHEDFIKQDGLGALKVDIAEVERMLKALIESLENTPLDP